MLSKSARDFILHITNYFHGHWEDPEWGRRPVNQILVSLAIRELANGIQDSEAREQIHTISDKVVSINAQRVVKEK
ncbi:conserved hypothetical protein [Candidatus Nitrotoga sp. BS]|uniref:hypothetical protein n=1 Tax=Candidatus Nitrotoga sp. BS TaxID=2890408 RepID=UPI001EF27E06|nr:hypothetical protein [Candidatus Nitrotoga sp. BS]CAH1189633.1 conserved hypothetical protein [Candidatus Nitrotoga sp. BS]